MPHKTPRSMKLPEEPPVQPLIGVARLRWLIEFAQQASGPTDPGPERRLIRTLGACLTTVTLRAEGDGQIVDLSQTEPTTLALPLRGADHQKSVAEKLALIRVSVQTLLQESLAHGVGQAGLQAVVTLRRTWSGGWVKDQPEAHDLRDALAYVLLGDLATCYERLSRCAAPGCGRLFVRERRQRYCSVSCRNRTTFRRWYRRHRKAGRRPTPDAAKKPGLPRTPRAT